MKKDMIVLLIACAVGVGVGAVWAAMPELTKEAEGFQNREEAIALNDFLSFKKIAVYSEKNMLKIQIYKILTFNSPQLQLLNHF